MRLEALREEVCEANRRLAASGLVVLTWGNVSGIDRREGLVVIKPSGVEYADLRPEHLVVVDIEGRVVEGDLRPSSDTPTHLVLYRRYEPIGGVAHTHSPHATMFAQACRGIPCLGTTHADHFHGEVPVTRPLRKPEIEGQYESCTGHVIVERLGRANPMNMPAVLVAHHGPFTWGASAAKAVENSLVLEEVARMALGTLSLAPATPPLYGQLLDKHFLRKHGPGAYYGQTRP